MGCVHIKSFYEHKLQDFIVKYLRKRVSGHMSMKRVSGWCQKAHWIDIRKLINVLYFMTI